MGDVRNTRGKPRSDIVCLEGNGSRPSHKGSGWIVSEVMYTLNSTEVHAVCYSIGSYHSNAWLSDNPHSGISETEISRTLDSVHCGDPTCSQGGIAIVEIYNCRTGSQGSET